MSDQEKIGDAPVEVGLREMLNALAYGIDEILNKGQKGKERKNGFILMVFPFDEVAGKGRCNYVSNANRDDVVAMLKHQVKRFEGQPDISGTA